MQYYLLYVSKDITIKNDRIYIILKLMNLQNISLNYPPFAAY